jgi:zinc protease
MSVDTAAGHRGAGVGRPSVTPPGAWHFPTPDQWTLDNGVRVVCFDVPGALLAAVTVLLDVPHTAEPVEREGVATILSTTLDEGTRTRTGEQFADDMSLHGGEYGAHAGNSAVHVTLDIGVGELEAGLRLVAEAVTEPTFPVEEVARHVQLRLAAIAQQRGHANVRAAWALDEACFAPTDRASRPGGGTPATVAPITRADVATLYETRVDPATTVVVLAADLSGTDVRAVLAHAFGSWSVAASEAGSASRPVLGTPPSPTPDPVPEAAVVVVDRPGSVQSALAIGVAAPDRTAPDWADLTVAAHVLGGSFSSRLMSDLREVKGYTYGISARFQPFRTGGLFVITTAVDTPNTGPALDAIRTVLRDFRAGGIRADERDDAVEYALGASPLRFQTARALVTQASALVADGLPPDWMNVLRARLPEVTAESAAAAFNRTVPDIPSVVVVGAADRVADPVTDLALGTVTVVRD